MPPDDLHQLTKLLRNVAAAQDISLVDRHQHLPRLDVGHSSQAIPLDLHHLSDPQRGEGDWLHLHMVNNNRMSSSSIQQINQSLNRSAQSQMQDLLQNKAYRVDKNRLFVVSLIHLLTACCFVFSMGFYQWTRVTLMRTQALHSKNGPVTLWTNLLYASLEEESAYYLSYSTLSDKICEDEDSFCKAILLEFDLIGKLCFSIFSVAFLVSLYDVVRIIRYWCTELVTKSRTFNEQNTAINFKNNFRIIFIFATYLIALTLSFFAVANMDLVQYSYGPSFWVFLGSLVIYALASIYENRKMAVMERQEMVIRLLESEKQALRVSKWSQSSLSENYTPI